MFVGTSAKGGFDDHVSRLWRLSECKRGLAQALRRPDGEGAVRCGAGELVLTSTPCGFFLLFFFNAAGNNCP